MTGLVLSGLFGGRRDRKKATLCWRTLLMTRCIPLLLPTCLTRPTYATLRLRQCAFLAWSTPSILRQGRRLYCTSHELNQAMQLRRRTQGGSVVNVARPCSASRLPDTMVAASRGGYKLWPFWHTPAPPLFGACGRTCLQCASPQCLA